MGLGRAPYYTDTVRGSILPWSPGGGPLKRTPGPVDELPLVNDRSYRQSIYQ